MEKEAGLKLIIVLGVVVKLPWSRAETPDSTETTRPNERQVPPTRPTSAPKPIRAHP